MTNRAQAAPQIQIQATMGQRARNFGVGLLKFMRSKPLGSIGLFIFMVTMIAGVFAPWIGRYDPLIQSPATRLQGPSWEHWLGTDEFGRDLYSRIVHGARISLQVSFASIIFGCTIVGLTFGVLGGYLGGWVDNLIQRISEVILAFPTILLALALVATLGSGIDKVIFAIAVVFGPRTIRVVRGSVLSVKQNVYVEAARALGASNLRIMARHILPNIMAPWLIVVSTLLGSAILVESTLSYLGLGVPPPHPSWGRMLSGGAQMYAISAPWMVIFPGAAITLLVLGFNLFGDALRDVWDPKLRGR